MRLQATVFVVLSPLLFSSCGYRERIEVAFPVYAANYSGYWSGTTYERQESTFGPREPFEMVRRINYISTTKYEVTGSFQFRGVRYEISGFGDATGGASFRPQASFPTPSIDEQLDIKLDGVKMGDLESDTAIRPVAEGGGNVVISRLSGWFSIDVDGRRRNFYYDLDKVAP